MVFYIQALHLTHILIHMLKNTYTPGSVLGHAIINTTHTGFLVTNIHNTGIGQASSKCRTHWLLQNSHMTSPNLSHDITQTATWHHPNCHMASPNLPHGITQIATRHPQTASWHHPNCHMASPKLLPGTTQTATWHHTTCHMASPKLLPGITQIATWHPQTATWHHPNCHMASPKLQHGITQTARYTWLPSEDYEPTPKDQMPVSFLACCQEL